MNSVLIIDDDEGLCQVFDMALSDAGLQTYTAVDGNDGLAKFEEYKPDLVITDVIMPDRDGIEVIAVLAESSPATPVIAISGGGRSGPEAYLEVCTHLDVAATFVKPVDIVELITTVKKTLQID